MRQATHSPMHKTETPTFSPRVLNLHAHQLAGIHFAALPKCVVPCCSRRVELCGELDSTCMCKRLFIVCSKMFSEIPTIDQNAQLSTSESSTFTFAYYLLAVRRVGGTSTGWGAQHHHTLLPCPGLACFHDKNSPSANSRRRGRRLHAPGAAEGAAIAGQQPGAVGEVSHVGIHELGAAAGAHGARGGQAVGVTPWGGFGTEVP